MAIKPPPKGAWLGHVNDLNFAGHQPSLERLIVSGAVNVGRQQCGKLVTVSVTSLSNWLSTIVRVQHGRPEALRRACLSAAAETF